MYKTHMIPRIISSLVTHVGFQYVSLNGASRHLSYWVTWRNEKTHAFMFYEGWFPSACCPPLNETNYVLSRLWLLPSKYLNKQNSAGSCSLPFSLPLWKDSINASVCNVGAWRYFVAVVEASQNQRNTAIPDCKPCTLLPHFRLLSWSQDFSMQYQDLSSEIWYPNSAQFAGFSASGWSMWASWVGFAKQNLKINQSLDKLKVTERFYTLSVRLLDTKMTKIEFGS